MTTTGDLAAAGTEATFAARLRAAVESYFTSHNLARDMYLRSLLNNFRHRGLILVAAVAKFPRVLEVCYRNSSSQTMVDPELIRECLRDSKVVSVSPDKKWISPIFPLPSLAPEEERITKAPDGRTLNSLNGQSRGSHFHLKHKNTWRQHRIESQLGVVAAGLPPQKQPLSGMSSPARENSSQYSCCSSYSSGNTTPSHNPQDVPVQRSGRRHSRTRAASPDPSFASSADDISQTNERTTVLLRETPRDCNPEQIIAAFTVDGVHPKAVKPDVENTWYLTFEKEVDAILAVSAAKERTIDGRFVRARIKSKTVPIRESPHISSTKFSRTISWGTDCSVDSSLHETHSSSGASSTGGVHHLQQQDTDLSNYHYHTSVPAYHTTRVPMAYPLEHFPPQLPPPQVAVPSPRHYPTVSAPTVRACYPYPPLEAPYPPLEQHHGTQMPSPMTAPLAPVHQTNVPPKHDMIHNPSSHPRLSKGNVNRATGSDHPVHRNDLDMHSSLWGSEQHRRGGLKSSKNRFCMKRSVNGKKSCDDKRVGQSGHRHTDREQVYQ